MRPLSRLCGGKLARILELEGLVRNTHDYKEIVSIFNATPRWRLLTSTLEELREGDAVDH